MEDTVNRLMLEIEGMSCGNCVRAVKQALSDTAGVQVEQVEVGLAVVSYDAAVVRPEDIDRVVTEEGYEVRGIREAS